MIKIDELREFRPTYRFEDGASISLEAVQNALIMKYHLLRVML